ncbi:hypothetical protein CTAYLR_007681 [Chrysophaeum taylorii]|uniref:Uncharacterized protein n=1 Tax=Chrysophaeum taylorii TaxID=2483200 RepID=A0AAD7U6H6_9STRA|nr:hypothetical protein CTAYLR_007681 [Chrysophaeum taylorii]
MKAASKEVEQVHALKLTSETGGLLSSASKLTLSASKQRSRNTSFVGECELVREAQLQLMEKIDIDIKHVVRSLEAIWNEVGYSDEERGLQMDKLSDELTQTLRAKLAQEVEVRDVFKKDIETKVRECEQLAGALGYDLEALEATTKQVREFRLSHGLMRLEEEQGRLEALKAERVAKLEPRRLAIVELAARLEHRLDHKFSVLGDTDLGDSRLRALDAKLNELRGIEALRTAEVAAYDTQSRALVRELEDDEEDAAAFEADATPGDVSLSALDGAKARLAALRDEKAARLCRLSTLGDQISLLWERLDVDAESQRRFRALCRESTIKMRTFRLGEAELAKLKAELKDRVGDLVAARRQRMTELWDEMNVAADERSRFAPFFADDSLDENALAEHEDMLAKLEARREALQPLLRLVERREELLDEREKIEKLQADPTRLTRRGPGAHAERKYEMEAERRLKQLPKITEKLIALIRDWEAKEGPFTWRGSSYLVRITETDAAWNSHKQHLKALAQAKKENILNGIPT